MMTKVLFVCTGNIFRSMTAEYSLRALLHNNTNISASSAGTAHMPDAKVRGDVAEYLGTKGLDVSRHQRRTLTPDLIREADLIIAMSLDHQSVLQNQFGTKSLLFTETCGGSAEPLYDVNDLFAPEDYYSPEAKKHVFGIIDQIIELSPVLADRLVNGTYSKLE